MSTHARSYIQQETVEPGLVHGSSLFIINAMYLAERVCHRRTYGTCCRIHSTTYIVLQLILFCLCYMSSVLSFTSVVSFCTPMKAAILGCRNISIFVQWKSYGRNSGIRSTAMYLSLLEVVLLLPLLLTIALAIHQRLPKDRRRCMESKHKGTREPG